MADWSVSFPKPCGERWETMAPAGDNRFCDRCARTIHDLERMTFDEAQALIRADPNACVRAKLGPDGAIALKRGRARRMVASVGATVGLLVATAPALADDKIPAGGIEGRITSAYSDGRTTVTAVDADGTRYVAKVRSNGHYRFRRLPAGTYRLTFRPECGDSWTLDAPVTVGDATIELPDLVPKGGCIVVGKLETRDDRG